MEEEELEFLIRNDDGSFAIFLWELNNLLCINVYHPNGACYMKLTRKQTAELENAIKAFGYKWGGDNLDVE